MYFFKEKRSRDKTTEKKTSQVENGCEVNASRRPVTLLLLTQRSTRSKNFVRTMYPPLPLLWMSSSSVKASQSNLDTPVLALLPPLSPKMFKIPVGRFELRPGSRHPDGSFTLSSRSLSLQFLGELLAFVESAVTFSAERNFSSSKLKNFTDGHGRKLGVLVPTPA